MVTAVKLSNASLKTSGSKIVLRLTLLNNKHSYIKIEMTFVMVKGICRSEANVLFFQY